jgi:hypothetical protein
VGYTFNAQGKLKKDLTYRGQRQIKIIECKYSTDGNIQNIIDHIYDIYDIYELLKVALQTHGTLKTEVKIIPIVISIAGTFNVKTLAEIAQLVSLKEEPPDVVSFEQLSTTKKSQYHFMYMHKNGSPIYKKTSEKSSPQRQRNILTHKPYY